MKILLQTTIPTTEDDWHIGRFSMLRGLIASIDGAGVVARDRSPGNADPILSTLDKSDFDQLWLFGVDGGEGITTPDCNGITAFSQRGGGVLTMRDHQDCGSSICDIGGVGAAHYFHTRNVDPDADRRSRDDVDNTDIDWPNYHSGDNGDYQRISADREHPLFRNREGGLIKWFPSHPHEGAVGVPDGDADARVVAAGTSSATGRMFPLVVALDATAKRGRGLAHSSFHHFVDYNWDPRAGCPSFVAEAAGDDVIRNPARLDDVKTYVRNAVDWLSQT